MSTIDFYTGAFPANRPNALSSVMDIRMKEGSRDRLHTKVSLGASDASVTLDGPVYRSANPMAPIYTNLSPQGQPMTDPADNDRYLLRQIPNTRGTVLPAMGVMVKF